MKTLLAAALLLGSTVGAEAVEAYGDYRDYFDARPVIAKPVIAKRAPRSASAKTDAAGGRRPADGDRVEMYRYDDGGVGRTPDLRPRSWDGGYVPVHPRSASPDGFWSPIDQSVDGRELRPAFEGRQLRQRFR
ncbi:hypothetical protein ACLBXO_25415 [Methylobacterium sp. C33D]|uniref:hypothetical protein n=1 Tax=Methylobacterium mesophilicum TaxID=39956 RepID=UPI002F340FC1